LDDLFHPFSPVLGPHWIGLVLNFLHEVLLLFLIIFFGFLFFGDSEALVCFKLWNSFLYLLGAQNFGVWLRSLRHLWWLDHAWLFLIWLFHLYCAVGVRSLSGMSIGWQEVATPGRLRSISGLTTLQVAHACWTNSWLSFYLCSDFMSAALCRSDHSSLWFLRV
jgi:hypothetical protein